MLRKRPRSGRCGQFSKTPKFYHELTTSNLRFARIYTNLSTRQFLISLIYFGIIYLLANPKPCRWGVGNLPFLLLLLLRKTVLSLFGLLLFYVWIIAVFPTEYFYFPQSFTELCTEFHGVFITDIFEFTE